MKLLSRLTLGTLAAALGLSSAHAQSLQRHLDDRTAKYSMAQGVAAFSLIDGKLSFAVSGFQDTAKTQRITEETLFEVGSVTKTMTALVLADMVVKGELALADPVERYLPDGIKLRDANDVPIQLVDLATHRSGLPRLSANLKPVDEKNPYKGFSTAMMWDAVRALDAKKLGARNAKYGYSNFAYGLLGEVLARKAGMSYEQLLQARVLTPLGLSHTFIGIPAAQASKFAQPHTDQLQPTPAWDLDAYAGAGAVRMSVRDFARYAQAALGTIDTPLKEAFALSMKVYEKGGHELNPVGLAWNQAPFRTVRVWNHDGGTFGSSASLWISPQAKSAGGALANTATGVTDLALNAMEPSYPVRDFASTKQKSINVPAEKLTALAGQYRLSEKMDVRIRAKDNQLFAQATGQGEFELFAKAELDFFAKVADIEISFAPTNDKGVSPFFTLYQNGSMTRANRVMP
jgi:serine-type D-Ala-D-Ala carboxypeptidase/endopeptidase